MKIEEDEGGTKLKDEEDEVNNADTDHGGECKNKK